MVSHFLKPLQYIHLEWALSNSLVSFLLLPTSEVQSAQSGDFDFMGVSFPTWVSPLWRRKARTACLSRRNQGGIWSHHLGAPSNSPFPEAQKIKAMPNLAREDSVPLGDNKNLMVEEPPSPTEQQGLWMLELTEWRRKNGHSQGQAQI